MFYSEVASIVTNGDVKRELNGEKSENLHLEKAEVRHKGRQ